MLMKKEVFKHASLRNLRIIKSLNKNIETDGNEKRTKKNKKLAKAMLFKIKLNISKSKAYGNQHPGVKSATPVAVSSQTKNDLYINSEGFRRSCVSPPFITQLKLKSKEYPSTNALIITKNIKHNTLRIHLTPLKAS